MLCVGEILNFMTLVALCWMLGCDWEMSVGGKREAELGRAGGWLGTNPSSLLRGCRPPREAFCGMRRWRAGDAQILGFDSVPGEGQHRLHSVTVNNGILK